MKLSDNKVGEENSEKDNIETTPSAIAQKKSLIMTLGNARDLDALLEMLQNANNEEIILQIITVLGALGKKETLPVLSELRSKSDNSKIKQRAKEAIDVINSLSNYD